MTELRDGSRALLASPWCAVAAAVLLWVVLAGHFAAHQELWVDETTQLSGLSLPVGELVDWLRGGDAARFDVPPDRMPPLSYLLGKLWAVVVGLSEDSLRWLGVCAVAGAIALAVVAARRAWGTQAGWLAGLVLASSPQLAVLGVEIRTYPLLLLGAAASFFFLQRWVAETDAAKRRPPLLGLVGCVAASIHLHYFGVVLAGGILCALAWVCLVERRRLREVVVYGALIGVAALGILPFLGAAVSISGDDEAAGRGSALTGLARLGYRLLGGHPVVGVYPLIAATLLAGAAALIAIGLARRHADRFPVALAVATAAGIGAAVIASVVIKGFDALRITYNSWALVPLALLSAAALDAPAGKLRHVGVAAATALLLANGAASLLLWRRPEPFAHSAGDRVAAEVERLGGPEQTIIVHDGASTWGIPYFPLVYRFGRTLPQFLATPGASGEVVLARLPSLTPSASVGELGGERLLLLASRQLDAAATKRYLREGAFDAPASPAIVGALEQAGWRRVRSESWLAMGAVQLTWYQRPGP